MKTYKDFFNELDDSNKNIILSLHEQGEHSYVFGCKECVVCGDDSYNEYMEERINNIQSIGGVEE